MPITRKNRERIIREYGTIQIIDGLGIFYKTI